MVNRSDRKRADIQLEAQNLLLAKIARDEPLTDIFNALIEFIEQEFQGALCSILLLDADNQLYLGAGPNLPPDYNAAIGRLKIGEGVGSCGTAAFRREPVIVADIANHPLWQDSKAIALQFGLQACWSSPILTSDDRVLGTFALYYTEVRLPQAQELELVNIAAHIAGIAIQREQVTLALRKNEERYSLATRAAKVGVWEWNLKTNDFYLDPNIKALLGYTDAEIPNDLEYWVTFVHPDDRRGVMAAAQAYLDGKKTEYVFEHRMLHKDGSIVWILVRGKLLRDEQGNPERMLGTDTDVTDRKLVEQELKALNDELEMKVAERTAVLAEQQHFIQTITESTTAILYIYDLLEQRNVYVNSQITQILGYSAEAIQAMGTNLFAHLTHPDDLSTVMEQMAQYSIAEDDAVLVIEYRMRHAKGKWCWLQSHDRVFKRTPEGLSWQIIGTAVDISDRKLAEQQLQDLNQSLETQVEERTAKLREREQDLIRATQLKDEFLANMSHELRTPLNAILGMTEGLQEGVFGRMNSLQLKALQTVERSGSHLLALISDILDLAKVESGRMELERTSTAVTSLCEFSLAFVKQQAFKKRIQLETKLMPNLPNLEVDERRICQVLINLLNNAVKFTPDGGRVTLEASLQPQTSNPNSDHSAAQPHLRIAVIDTGIGIAPEHFSKLFQSFVQIESSLNRQYEGTGLGLALVKRIVELHGGQVMLTSEVGIGSCFEIYLPYVATPSLSGPEPEVSLPSNPAPRQMAQTQSPLILLVEDNESNIITMSSYLRAKGYRLVMARNGQEAIDLAQSERPDLILMDVQMPGMDGLTAMKHIRQDPNLINVPIIALTGLAMTGDREHCLAAGANDYLSKPVKLRQLTTTIQSLLMTKKAGQ